MWELPSVLVFLHSLRTEVADDAEGFDIEVPVGLHTKKPVRGRI